MDKFFGNWLDDSVIREDSNGNRFIKRFTRGKIPVEVAVSTDCVAAFGGQGYGEVHELKPISKKEYERFGIAWEWNKSAKESWSKKIHTDYMKEYSDIPALVRAGVLIGIVPEYEEDKMIKDLTRIYENLDCNRKEDGKVIMHFSNPTAIKLTSEGMPYVPLTLDCLPGLYKDFQRREKEKRRDKENPIKEDTQEARELPRELNTPQAKEILQRCIDSGHLDKDFQPIKGTTTNGQLFYIALYTSYMLWNTARWKPFERLWGAPHLQQEKVWLMAQWRKESIDALFSKDIIEKALKLG